MKLSRAKENEVEPCPNQPIGIFDSGVGGITVLKEVYRHLPLESIIYFGDTARVPYGNRSQKEILEFTRSIISWMCHQKIKMAIVACNTSSALALDTVKEEFNLPILGLIKPCARGAVAQGKRIGIMATKATISSNAYPKAIYAFNHKATVLQVACPELVPLIESNRLGDSYTKDVVKQYLYHLLEQKIDALIYGCTHYPLLESVFQELLPSQIKVLDPAKYVAEAASRKLKKLKLNNMENPLPTHFYVSGSAYKFASTTKQWLGFTPMVKKISLEKTSHFDKTSA